MELWIRSQDRTDLICTNRIYAVNNQIRTKVYGEIGFTVLGEYKTKERALEVLDEIEEKINLINLGHDFGSPMVDFDNPTYIYRMPEE